MQVVYRASMYTGEFESAVEYAQKLCQQNPNSIEYARQLSESLAAKHSGGGATAQFMAMTKADGRQPDLQLQFDVERAGLALMSNDEFQIREIVRRVGPASPKLAGEVLERVGRWYYAAGKYEEALKHLTNAQEVSPALPNISIEIGWAALQNNKIQTAQSSFASRNSPEARAGLAISMWRTEERDRAVALASDLPADPRWKNERWISVTYGTSAFKSLAEINSEIVRRVRARKG
jgi:tetratricopeptide (TPR) repeat protein